MGKIRLNVLGLSYSQTQAGAYALVLSEEDGDRRIPIIIGGFEAQAIAIELEGLKPPRPLTHDLILSISKAYNIHLVEVNIYKLEEGIFYSELVCTNGTNQVKIDARTSDAVATALRFQSPIYTTEEIMMKAGIILDIEAVQSQDSQEPTEKETQELKKKMSSPTEYKSLKKKELEVLLTEAIQKEDYEKASHIRDELNKRK